MANKKIDLRKLRKKNPRNDRIEMLLTGEEKSLIIAMAEKERLPLSTFIRWKLLRQSV